MRGHKRPRGTNRWEFFAEGPRTADGRRRQRTMTFHGTEREADVALARFTVEVADQVVGDAHTITVGQLLEEWVKHRSGNWEPNTLHGYRSKIDLHIVPHIGKVRVAKLSAYDCDRLYNRLTMTGQSPNSVKRVHAILHAACAQAVRWQWLRINPVTDATPPKVDAKEPDDLSPAVVAHAVATAPGELASIARLAAVTGAREAELCGLRWTDLDTTAHTLRIQRRCVAVKSGTVIRPLTKTRTLRVVGLDRRTVAMLRLIHYRARQRARACGAALPADAYVFSETAEGTPLSPNVVGQRWYRHRRALDLTLRFHDLRHFSISIAQADGIQRGRVSKRVGHSRESTTSDVYTHVLRADDHDIADGIAKRLRGR